MKPNESAARLEELARWLATNAPAEYQWLPALLLRRVRDSGADLDRLLGLRSRSGGRGGYVGSPLPERDRLLREFAAKLPGTTKDKAKHIADLARRKDAALNRIACIARSPAFRQLQRILANDI